MPNKMIPFPYEIKLTHSDFCYDGIYCSNKDGHSGSLFLFYFFISMKTNSDWMNCTLCITVITLRNKIIAALYSLASNYYHFDIRTNGVA